MTMDRRYFSKLLTSAPLLANYPHAFGPTSTDTCMQRIKKPSKLVSGDKVALVAPGSPIKPEKFDNALRNVEALGLEPLYSDRVYLKHGYLAGTDEERIRDLHTYFADDSVKAIWALRGGYGCTRLLPYLDYSLIKKNPKIVLGYSDITALLLAIHAKTGMVGFHGPVASSSILPSYNLSQLKSLLFEGGTPNKTIPFQPQSDAKSEDVAYVIYPGKAHGKLIGGNLSLLVNLPNTPFAPSYKNKIVFIEDVGEKPYRIDRMLTYLMAATDLAEASGIILGVFADCEPDVDDASLTLKETLMDRLAPLKIPCFYGATFGHVTDICTFPIGISAAFDTDSAQLNLLESCLND